VNRLRRGPLPLILLASAATVVGATDLFDPINLRQAKGVVVALYNEDSGVRYAKIQYEEFSKRPSRIGFLKVGLPILTFHDLSLHLEAKQANAKSILMAIEKTVNSRSARYLFGENVTMTITDGENALIKLQSPKANFHRTGLRFSEGVEIFLPGKEQPFRCESIFLRTKQETNSLTLVTPKGYEAASVQLGIDDKSASEAPLSSDKPQSK